MYINPIHFIVPLADDPAIAYALWLDGKLIQAEAQEFYRTQRQTILSRVAELRGRDLCCWCPLDQPCHADVLLELANPRDG